MTIAVTRSNSFQSLAGNAKGVKYRLVFTAEPYVTGGIEINSADHMKYGNNFDGEALGNDFKTIDHVEFINNPLGAAGYFANALTIDNTTENEPKFNMALYAVASGAQHSNGVNYSATHDIIVHGVPPCAPGGVNR